MKNAVTQNMMRERQSTTALSVPRSLRPHDNAFLSRMMPGVVVPIAAAGLLREDAVTAGRLNCTFQMAETAEVLINPVSVKVSAYLVPWMAFERFAGRDEFEASYSKKPLKDGDPVIPFIETVARGGEGTYPVLDALGLHGAPTQQVSTMYIEAYNLICNYRNKQLSLKLQERTRLQADLAPAQREIGRHRNIVGDFDDAKMEGVVDIDVLGGGRLPLKGIAPMQTSIEYAPASGGAETDVGNISYDHATVIGGVHAGRVLVEQLATGQPNIRVEMDDGSLQFSLAAIERAKKLRMFAKLRERYSGLDDDAVIDKLMDGIRLPEKMFEQPIYLGSQTAAFGFSQRYATDSANLDKHVVQGAAMLSMQIATPRINPGGVLMFVAEIQPEQLFEREADPFLTITDVDKYPQYIRDEGDEQKVDFVYNREIDTAHANPDGVFGYGPLNGKFMVRAPRIGTGYFMPAPDPVFDENRERIWDATPINPALGTDWHLVRELTTNVFKFTNEEPFEAAGRLSLVISGNTVFGRTLIESDGDYEKVDDRVPGPEDQIDLP